jgi:hypothetical protein
MLRHAMRSGLAALASGCAMQAAPALAEPPPRMPIPRALIGAWAGEGIGCPAPKNHLHLFRRERTLHPRIFDGEVGHACRVLNVRGHAPSYRLRLLCRPFGSSSVHSERPVMQVARLSKAGMRLDIEMFATNDGEPLRKERLCRCSGTDPSHRRPHRQD